MRMQKEKTILKMGERREQIRRTRHYIVSAKSYPMARYVDGRKLSGCAGLT
jgi:hypothetical protein